MNPIISIITTAYNHEQFIAECIESVLAQTYEHWEMLIVDDASTDATSSIVERFMLEDSRIRLIRHDSNWGIERLNESYNEALSLSRGELVAILEADDLWLPEKLMIQVPAFDDPQVVLAHSDIRLIGAQGNLLETTSYLQNPSLEGCLHNEPLGRAYRCLLLGRSPIAAVTAVIRKVALIAVGGFQAIEGINTTDYPTWMALAAEGGFFFTGRPLAKFRRHSDASSMGRLSVVGIEVAIRWVQTHEQQQERLYAQAGFKSLRDLKQAQSKVLLSRQRNFHLQRASKALQISDWKTAREEMQFQARNETLWWRTAIVRIGLFLVTCRINPLNLVSKTAVKKLLARN